MPELLGRLQSALSDRYRLDREIGAGGMATVYLAEDVRHDRRVALKVLRPELAAVIGAERFLAEIKLTANLQHPHILPLFDSGEADGYLFYVMPFVEGETLRDRMNREKQLPVNDAVRITTEVASALDYAHRHGVVHRDIKPENILLHDGQALVADFGIALAASKASGARMTETGMSLGTPHYMSPEQAMGEREITARSDVYAIGAVLYEMLTGDPPFTGSTAQAVVARVVTESPRPLVPQRHTIPPHVEAAVLTALEKLPADRFASAAEFAEALKDKTYRSTVVTGPVGLAGVVGAGARGRRSAVVYALAGALVLAVGAAVWGWLRPTPVPPLTQFSLGLRINQTLQAPLATGGSRIALSRDGRSLVYSGPAEGGNRLWVRRFDQLDASPIAGTEGSGTPFFSPEGDRIGFVKSGTAVRIASLAGAPTVTLSDKLNTTGGTWATDGYIYFEVDSGIARMRAAGGDIEPVYTIKPDKNEIATEWPQVLPGNTGVVFRTRHVGQGVSDFEIMAAPLPPRPHAPAHTLVRGVYALYAPTGHLLVVTADGKLIAIPFNTKKLALTGAPIALLEGIGVRNGGFNVDLALAANGTLAYTTGGTLVSRRAVWVSMEGGVTPVDADWDPQGVIESAALSPNGKEIAVGLSRDGRRDIWVKQLPDGPFSRITFGDTSSVRPSWSADGREVYYVNDRAGSGVGPVYAHRADGTGAARLLKSSQRDDYGQALISRDGKWLLLRTAPVAGGSPDILGLHPPDTATVPLVATPAQEVHPALSADGRWLAYSSNESGTFEVYVRPFPETSSAKWQVSTAGGSEPAWSKDGRRLFYISGRNEMISADVAAGPGFTLGKQRPLFNVAQFTRTGPIPSYSLAPDGEHFLMVREGESTQQSELIVAENWLQTLKGK
ncbi:MAG TPA: LpqB family beta-propeller domain-containing protein [Gemmatimonadales bacterium]|nr:LpqB family beta-propeller domain-containing protein [Gemmatimonadales bacterium]